MKAIRKDEVYVRFKRILANASQLDLDKLYEEIKTLHSGRTMRGLKSSVSPKKIIGATLQDQSYRSRLVEINLLMTREYAALKAAYDATKDHLNSKFGKDIGVRSIADRDAYWRSKLSKAVMRIDKLANMIELAEMVIEDIDKAGYAAKNIIAAFEIATRPEINV